MKTRITTSWSAATLACGIVVTASGQSFVNFESPQVHPIEVTPGGDLVLVVNTADNRLEILARTDDGGLERLHGWSVPGRLQPGRDGWSRRPRHPAGGVGLLTPRPIGPDLRRRLRPAR